ncbi:MAG TPA: hypothetical protein VGH84_02700 [Steroidobacteraceae bacterium]|jgi:hypothetical protein
MSPVLFADLDAVLLIRLYPDAAGISDAGTQALAQGEATALAGETLEASQYEPVLILDADVTPQPAR